MRFALQLLLLVAWALWLGCTGAMFVFAPYLFHRFGIHSDIAKSAANALFIVFGRYELCLAGLTVLATGMLLINFGNKWTPLLLLALICAAGIAVTTTLGFTPLMESLRAQGRTDSLPFQRLHKKSVIAMTIQLAVLMASGGLILRCLAQSLSPSSRSRPSGDAIPGALRETASAAEME
jgi:hypothetical protein